MEPKPLERASFMKFLGYFRAFLKRKTTWFAMALGVFVGLFSAWRLPYSPRCQLIGLDHIERLFFSPHGKTLAAVDGSPGFQVHLWDFSTRNKVVEIPLSPISDPINDLGSRLRKHFVPLRPPHSHAFSRDGKTFFVFHRMTGKGTDRMAQFWVQFWDLATGKGNTTVVIDFGNGEIEILDPTTRKHWTLERSALVTANASNAVSPVGKLLAIQVRNRVRVQTWLSKLEEFLGIASPAKKVVLYELPSWNELTSFDDATLPRFSPDGQTLVLHRDGALHFHDIPLRNRLGKILLFAIIAAAPLLLLGQAAALWNRKRARNNKSDHDLSGER
jgi:WD40 repeat protein